MITVRPIQAKELPKVQTIAHLTWPSTFANILSPEQIDYMLQMMYGLKVLENQFEKGHLFLLAEEDGKALGFAGFELDHSDGPKAKLHKIYLLPETQGKGLGKQLIQEVVSRAKDKAQKSLLLNVNKYNQGAIAFYEYLGFVNIKSEIIDIGNGYVMDDYVFELKL